MTNKAAQTMPGVDAFMSKWGWLILSRCSDEFRADLAALSQTAGVADGYVAIPKHYAENVGYAAAMLENSASVIDRHNAPALRDLMSLMLAAAPAASGVHPDALPDGTLSKSTAKRVEALGARGGEVSHVTIDFPQVGTAGPFKVIDGRMTLPDVTMNDLIHHARMGYVPASNPTPAASVSERARELIDRCRNGRALRNDGLVEIGQAIDAIEQALTQQRGEVAWKHDAESWGNALNEAAWVFVEQCPEKSALLFNNTKAPLRAAILKYAELVGVATTPQPSADAVREVPDGMEELREKIEAMQEFKPWAHKNTNSRKGFVTSMRKAKSPEEGEEYGWVNKGTILALLSAASGEKGVG